MKSFKQFGLLWATSGIVALACEDPSVESQLTQSYAPVFVDCPVGVDWIRPATQLNPREEEWVSKRKKVVLYELHGYLQRLGIEDFDVDRYIGRLRKDTDSVPTLGIAISGGGWASAFTGTGAIRALDSRLDAANEQRTGGLLQSMTYMSGLSGGAWPIMSLSTYGFPTADELAQYWQPQIDRTTATTNSTYAVTAATMIEQIVEKEEAGYNISIADFFGRAWAYEFVAGANGGLQTTFSDVAGIESFITHQMPFPLVQAASVEEGDTEYYDIMIPNLQNSTIYEFTPYEFGAWSGAVKAFTPMEYLGTELNHGQIVNQSACVRGFDRASFILGTVGGAFNFWWIEDVSNGTLAPFSKRSPSSLDGSKRVRHRFAMRSINPEAAFPEASVEALLEVFTEILGVPFLQTMYAWYPNPFAGLNSSSSLIRDAKNLQLVDGSENGQSIPLWGQIQPHRKSDFIIGWDGGGDAPPYFWNNGTNLYDTYLYTKARGIPFPVVPSAATFIARNYTTSPVFFGCEANLTTTNDTRSPIIAYFANAPYSAYSNMSYTQANTSYAQLDEIWVNSFNEITQGNSTLDAEWPVCLGCAAIERSLARVEMERTKQCQHCFKKYCWDGVSEPDQSTEVVDPSLVLDPSLGFLEWVKTNPFGN